MDTEKLQTLIKLQRNFYERDTIQVAKDLLGKILVHNVRDEYLAGIITETEAYKEDDKASHFYRGKRTPRTEVVFGRGGFAYVYLIYGMYHCLNVVTEKKDVPGAVLIRKIEPILGIEEMIKNRKTKPTGELKKISDGPGKLCMALNITKGENGEDLTGENLYIAESLYDKNDRIIKCGKRINIDYAEECKDYWWRFYI